MLIFWKFWRCHLECDQAKNACILFVNWHDNKNPIKTHFFVPCKQTLELFWNPTPTVKSQRLKRHTISMEAQSEFESEKLWSHVSDAIVKGDQQVATDEKCFLEEEQRKSARERKAKLLEWTPNLFERNAITGDWIYKYAEWVKLALFFNLLV